ncbi:MAG: alpha/beta hydrolase family protein [Acidimicrobiia bacterium]
MRMVKWLAIGLVMLGLAALVGGGWYYSDVLREDGLAVEQAHPPDYLLEVLAVADGTITLPRTSETEQDGVWGLEWPDGYAQVGGVAQLGSSRVVRELRVLSMPPEPGQMVRLDGYAFPENPGTAFGLAYQEVAVVSDEGPFPAWHVEGTSDIWAVFVHGKGAERREALRLIPTVAQLGLPSLVISYRNDPDAPPSADGLHHFGVTEWMDLEAAVDYARAEGARGVVLVGYSMGGAVVMSYLYRAPTAPLARAAVLDAPVLDFGATIDEEAERRGIPPLLTNLAKAISAARFGVSWSALDLVGPAEELQVPILLFHGTEDRTVFIETSEALAAARPDLVSYVPVPEAGHVESWNVDPLGYESAVRDFLKRSLDS